MMYLNLHEILFHFFKKTYSLPSMSRNKNADSTLFNVLVTQKLGVSVNSI